MVSGSKSDTHATIATFRWSAYRGKGTSLESSSARGCARERKRAAKDGEKVLSPTRPRDFRLPAIVGREWGLATRGAAGRGGRGYGSGSEEIKARAVSTGEHILLACDASVLPHATQNFISLRLKYISAFIIVRNGLNLSSRECRTCVPVILYIQAGGARVRMLVQFHL
jgi:hypothetical protein